MSRRPYHRRYHSDALVGTLPLTLEERGALITILDMLYDCGEPIVQNDRYLSGCMGCSLRKYRAVRDSLIEKGKIHITDCNRISNFRFEKEAENDVKFSRKQAENGSKPKDKLAENEKIVNENNGTEKPKGNPRASSTSTSTSTSIEGKPTPEGVVKKPTQKQICLQELEAVVDPKRAEAIWDHRIAIKSKLTPHSAQLLAASISKCPDYAEAADIMIESGWKSVQPSWIENRNGSHNGRRQKTSNIDTIREANRRVLERRRAQDSRDIFDVDDFDGPTIDA